MNLLEVNLETLRKINEEKTGKMAKDAVEAGASLQEIEIAILIEIGLCVESVREKLAQKYPKLKPNQKENKK